MDDQVRLDALNHIQSKIKAAREKVKSALEIDDKIYWLRTVKRYKKLRQKMFQ